MGTPNVKYYLVLFANC